MSSITATKYMKVLACAFGVAVCLALAACGGSSGASSAASEAGASSAASEASASSGEAASASAEAASESAAVPEDPVQKFTGSWKLAAAEMQGVMVTGDFSSEMFSGGISMALEIAADGTGSMTFNGESADLTWQSKDDNTITIAPTSSDTEIKSMDVTYENDVLSIEMSDDQYTGKVYLSHDGTMQGMRDISLENAVPVTSEAEIVGSWKLTGVSMQGMSMYGDAESLAAIMGSSVDPSLVINEGGTASILGADATWSIGADGASLTMEGVALPIKKLDSDIVLDFTSVAGDQGSMCVLYSK